MRQVSGRLLARALATVALIPAAVAVSAVGARPAAAAPPGGSATAAPAAHPPAGSTDEGPASPAQRLDLTVVLRPADAAALAGYATGVSTPGDPSYHRYLTPQAFAQRFGDPPSGVAAVRQWLQDQNFTVGPTSTDNLSIPLSATVGQVEKAFHLSIDHYRTPSGRQVYANRQPALVPASLGGYVQTVLGLDDLTVWHPAAVAPASSAGGAPARRAGSVVAPAIQTSGPAACSTATTDATNDSDWLPGQLATAYQMQSLYSSGLLGGSVTVGLFELEKYSSSDIAAYQSCFATSTSVTTVSVDGGATGSTFGSGEAALDIEDVIGLAPQTDILVYEAPNSTTGVYDNYSAMVNQDKSQVISTSWGACEQAEGTSFIDSEATLFQQAAVQGQTVLAAAGDSGSSDCVTSTGSEGLAVDDPASQPYVTGVGGTSLTSVSTPPTETVWNDQCSSGPCAGGGGVSTVWTMPSWQNGPGVVNADSSGSPCGAPASYSCREVPDVTASADPYHGYLIYYKGSWRSIGGTSAAAPLWASIVALVDNGCAAGPVGFINPRLYASAGTNASPFNDITTGNNAIYKAADGLYPATSGYDMASGLGSPIAAKLLGDLCAPLVSSISPSTGPSGGGTTVTVNGVGFTPGSVVDFGTDKSPDVVVDNATELTAVSPPGAGTVDVTVVNGGGTSAATTADQFVYGTPSIADLSATSASEGTQVTITGAGFGATQGSSYVTFVDAGVSWGAPSDAAGLVIDSWSGSSVTFTVPEPSGSQDQWQVTPGTEATVAVDVGGVASNPATLGVIPTSTFTMTGTSSVLPGGTVTLTSSNAFGAGPGYVVFSDSGISWGAPVDAAKLTGVSWGSNSIAFQAPGLSRPWAVTPGTTATVTVVTASGAESNAVQVQVAPTGTLSITSSTSAAQPGATVTLSGTSLGVAGWVSFVDGAISWGAPSDAASLTVNCWNTSACQNQITFTVPTTQGPWEVTPGTEAQVTVTNSAGYVSNTVSLAVQPSGSITLSSPSPSSAPEGTVVTLTSSGGFGATQGTGYVTFVDNGISWGAPSDAARLVIDSWSDTQITFTVPEPSGADYQWQVTPGTTATVSVTSGSFALSNTVTMGVSATATIPLASVSPTSGPAGQEVTLSGAGFGAAQGAGYVTLVDNGTSWGAPTDAATFQILSWGNESVVFYIPSPSGPGEE